MTHLELLAFILGLVVLIEVGSFLKEANPSFDSPKGIKQSRTADTTRQRNLGQKNTRIAVFGSGNAWGSGLEHRFEAYPYLLSPTVHNFAEPSGGPNYFSVCTKTVVGDDQLFDVIVLDYWLRASEGLDELARRLRQRYPQAIIILVRAWMPIHFKRRSCVECNDVQSLLKWKQVNNLDGAGLQTVIQALQADDGHWYLPKHQEADESIRSIIESVKGYEFTFGERATGVQTLIDFMGYYDTNSHGHLSVLGHQAVAHAIEVIVSGHRDIIQEGELVNSGVNGHWGLGDSCNFWYNSGGTNLIFGDTLSMVQYDEHNGHFALEISGPGWFLTDNNLEHSGVPLRTLYVSYLTDHIGSEYPDAEVQLNGESWYLNSTNDLDPHHNVRTLPLGKVPTGKTNVTIAPVGSGRFPFRLVGVSFTNEISVPMEWRFGPASG